MQECIVKRKVRKVHMSTKPGMVVVSTNIVSPVARVSFELLYDDWCLLERSEVWHRVSKFLAETQIENTRMSRKEKKDLLEGK